MAASYPTSLPVKNAAGANLSTDPHSTLHDGMYDEIVALATELGTLPKGTFATVKARLDDLSKLGAGCSLFRSAFHSIANTTNTAITFDLEDHDTNAFHDNVTNNSRITIPSGYGGKYVVTFAIDCNASITGSCSAWIVKNGNVADRYGGATYSVSSAVDETLNGSAVLPLVAADYLEIYFYQSTGAAVEVLNSSGLRSRFCVARVGA